ncbi:hypothetical protein BY996DRAFT_4591138 [Phakopsora pachyrhizi]|uniref:Rho-GAP domain-containing protein n=1 Tax=Phakopsora pachyrhizi TaxID=170000 RepID=A0AAV0AJM3_PHAPC|nr:hypothetical protein BY996DRAFT_4591138 [Phakopsora pachyrhizi]CAH7668687.1 hypothetical protein PPACK8108_LOCUS3230 [Phakopsora pachyrhizi]
MSSVPHHHHHPVRCDDVLVTYTTLIHEADAYISFFKKRCEIEEEYHHQLSRLASRQNEVDRKLACEHPEGIFVPQSARLAWQEVSANVHQEALQRKNWIKRIRENVIEPLERFRSMKDRTLNRIREELRASTSEHKEYLSTVQRLKKNYDRKCEEVNQTHAMIDALEVRDRLIEERHSPDWEHISRPVVNPLSSTSPSLVATQELSSSQLQQHTLLSSSSSSSSSNSPHLGRKSNDLGSSNNRSPVIISGATSSALRDTATPPPANPLQAKGTDVLQALRSNTNNFIQRLNSRKDNKAASQSQSSAPFDDPNTRPTAIRAAKVKREAEDADRDYRKGVFHLETLRLRKEVVMRGARRATEDMVYESSGEAKEAFAYYIDETRIAAVSWISICDHAQHLVSKINPDLDARTFVETEFEEFQEPKVLYENAFTGPCRSLLFGVAINDYCASNPGKGWVPLLVRMCIEEIEKRGMRVEGLYRISGKMQSVTQLVHEIEKDEDTFKFDSDRHDIFTISGVLKLYLRQLPQPLFPFPLVERVSFTNQIEDHRANGFRALSKRLRRLPPAHQATLKLVCEHLARVASLSEENKMTPSNLGVVFAPVVFLDDASNQQLPSQAWKDNLMEVLIENHEVIFEGLPTAEPLTLERSRSQRGSMVNRTVSPSARKSLEADRFESYSRSVSPQRSSTPPPQVDFLPLELSPKNNPSSISNNTASPPAAVGSPQPMPAKLPISVESFITSPQPTGAVSSGSPQPLLPQQPISGVIETSPSLGHNTSHLDGGLLRNFSLKKKKRSSVKSGTLEAVRLQEDENDEK